MPELPDVEIFRRLVHDRCRGRRIRAITISDADVLQGISAEALARRIKGEQLVASRRYGKYLFILLNRVGALAMHFGTNGSLEIRTGGEADPAYVRLMLHFDQGERLAYINPRRIGRVSLCESVEAFVASAHLGPDALDSAFDRGALMAMLGASQRTAKSVLMDQTMIAGIGNIYSDEILFQAGLRPTARANQLTRGKVSKLFDAMRETLETAIRCGAGAEQAMENWPKEFLLPHRRKGGHCPRCGGNLVAIKEGGRTSYYCPHCQGE